MLLRRGSTLEQRLDRLRNAVLHIARHPNTDGWFGPDRVSPILGDVCHARLGLDLSTVRQLERTVTVVIHAAANTKFQSSRHDSHAVNVTGTHNLLDVSRRLVRLEQLLFVSTACVAGTRTGLIREEPLTAPPHFVNTYEDQHTPTPVPT